MALQHTHGLTMLPPPRYPQDISKVVTYFPIMTFDSPHEVLPNLTSRALCILWHNEFSHIPHTKSVKFLLLRHFHHKQCQPKKKWNLTYTYTSLTKPLFREASGSICRQWSILLQCKCIQLSFVISFKENKQFSQFYFQKIIIIL